MVECDGGFDVLEGGEKTVWWNIGWRKTGIR